MWAAVIVEVVALAVCYNIPVLKSPDDVQYLETAEQHRFTLASQGVGNGASVTIDPLMASILRIFESKKKQIQNLLKQTSRKNESNEASAEQLKNAPVIWSRLEFALTVATINPILYIHYM